MHIGIKANSCISISIEFLVGFPQAGQVPSVRDPCGSEAPPRDCGRQGCRV